MPRTPPRIGLLSTGVPNLDGILGGGLPEYSMTMLAGLAGTGKTTLAQQISFHTGTVERPAIYIATLGEPVLKLLRYQQQFDFFDPDQVGSTVHFIDIGRRAAAEGTGGALEAIREQLERLSPGLVVVDSFRAIDDLTGGSTVSRRQFTHELSVLLAGWQCTTLLLGEYTEEQAGVGPEFTVADNVLFLSQEIHNNSVVRRLRVVKARGMSPQPGRHAFRIRTSGIEVYPRLPHIEEAPKRRKRRRASMGVSGLDEMMNGGIPRGQTCMVAGSSGTGKTLLALHFAVAGAEAAEPCVMATFEESPAEHAEKMISFGWDLRDFEKRGLLKMVYLRPVDLSIDEVMYGINKAVEEIGAQRVVINSISGMEIALPQTERADLREGLYRLTANLTARGLVALLTTEMPDLFGAMRLSEEGLSFLADNALLLRYVEIGGQIRRALMVVKMRTSSHENTLREYRIGPGGMRIEKSFEEYSGVLTGVPTLSAILQPRPYTAGLGSEEEAAMHTLLALKQASPEELAASLGSSVEKTRRLLSRLEDTGYVMQTVKAGLPIYRVALLAPASKARR